ncbi:MAG TPA: fatty acid desaturase [Caulobacteraceae bacterium]|nr:fatty acid desaturase [Caulobacteraceae bacterium]
MAESDELLLRDQRAKPAPPDMGRLDGGQASEIGRLRARLNAETNGDYRRLLSNLRPDYGRVWRDIGFGYAALVFVLALAALPVPLAWSAPVVLAAALLVGYALAYLQLFIHEAAHHNLAADRALNDRLANAAIAWHLGADTAAYRVTHFAHHRNHGLTTDTERSYFRALDGRFMLEMLSGVNALRTFLGRRREQARAAKPPRGLTPLARGLVAHLVIVGGLYACGAWRAAIAWVIGVGVFLPFFGALRQILEHRSPEADPNVDYARQPHGAYTRIFKGGLLAHTFGGAGFDRHLLHHWEPQVSYTRLAELEAYMRGTSARAILEARTTTYCKALGALMRRATVRVRAADAPSGLACYACGSAKLSWWCAAADPEYRSTEDRFDYFRCADCGGLSISPCPEDRLSEIYPETYYSYAGESFSLLGAVKHWLDRRLFNSVFAGIPGERLAALDVGGGSGWLLDQARQAEPRLSTTVVVDVNPTAESRARASGHDFVLSRIEDFSDPRRFDLITMLNLIEHVRRPGEVLAKARDCLTDDGVLLIKTPNCDSLDARLLRKSYWGGLHSPRHWVLFTPEGFRRAAAEAGLRVERLQLTQGAPFWATSTLAWMERRGLVRFSRQAPMYRHRLFAPLLAIFAAFDYARRPFMRTSQMFVVLKRA